MKELNFYSNKVTSAFLLIVSALFVVGVIFIWEKILNFEENPFKSAMLFLGFLLFVFGIILSLLLLFRRKPLLTITNNQIIIYNVIAPKKVINIDNIKSFFIVNNYYRGIATNKQIFIELKVPDTKYSSSSIYKLILKFSKPIANSQYSIQTNFLNIKQNKLLEILNQLI